MADNIAIALVGYCLLPVLLRLALSAFGCLHLHTEGVVVFGGHQQQQVGYSLGHSFSLEDSPGYCVPGTAIWHRKQKAC